MLRGRHRGLPMAIDRAVLLPGQELMERMDKEYNGTGAEEHRAEEKEEIRKEETGIQAETKEEGQDPVESGETKEKMY